MYVVFDKVNRLEEYEYIGSNKKKGLEVSTIDKYQGRDKETIILSMAKSNDAGKTGRLLEEKRRLNVAFSRAKMKLIIIGSYNSLRGQLGGMPYSAGNHM
jgi:DNA replication ATP-dependent helicase Dna2